METTSYRPAGTGLLRVSLGLFALVAGTSLGHRLSCSDSGHADALCSILQGTVFDPLLAVVSGGVVLAFCLWLSRARLNLRALCLTSAPPPLPSLLWFFVPLANLYMPFAGLRTLWAESDPRAACQPALRPRAPRLLLGWWSSWGACLLAAAACALARVFAPGLAGVVGCVALACAIIAACLLTAVAHTIFVRQEAKCAALGLAPQRPARSVAPRAPFSVSCLCGAVLKVRPGLAGQTGKCPECRDTIPLKPLMSISC